MEAFLDPFSGILLYGIVLAMLIACGFGLPISEDLLLIVIGFLIQSGKLALVPSLAVAFVGCLAGDFILFNIGYHYGEAVMRHRFVLRVISHGRREKILAHFRRYGEKFIFFARFFAGVRAPTFLTAGMSRMKPSHFVGIDAAASLLSVPIFVALGYLFGDNLDALRKDIYQIQRGVIVTVIAVVSLVITARYLNLFRSEEDQTS